VSCDVLLKLASRIREDGVNAQQALRDAIRCLADRIRADEAHH
jgi:hypothetical protein